MPEPDRIAAVRRFNRFYTARLGVLREGLHQSRFSLAEARVLYELAQAGTTTTAGDIATTLDLDPGYLSRILQRLQREHLIERTSAPDDRRRQILTLTPAGRAAFAPLDAAAREEIGALLAPLPDPAQTEVIAAMGRIETLLAPTRAARSCSARRVPATSAG